MQTSQQTQKEVIQLLNKNIIGVEKKSITETLCPKYRKFTNFPKGVQQQRGRSSSDTVKLKLTNKQSAELNKTNKIQGVQKSVTQNSQESQSSQQSLSKKIIIIPQQFQNRSTSLNQAQSPLLKQRKQQQPQPTSQYQPSPSSTSLRPFNQQKARQQITSTFTQLNTMILNISQHFEKRMKTHQDQLLKIMMLQIKRLNLQCEKTIQKYNELIKFKAANSGNDQILMQLRLYKKHLQNMQQENIQLKKQIQYLKRLNNQYQMKIRTDQQALKQVTKKLLHYKKKSKHYQSEIMGSSQSVTKKSLQYIKGSPIIGESEYHTLVKQQGLPQISAKQYQSSSSVLQKSKPISFTKSNSRSLAYSRRSHAYSVEKSLKSPKITSQILSPSNNNHSLENTLLIKLNQQINKKYKSHQRIDQIKSFQQTKAQQSSIKQAQQQQHQIKQPPQSQSPQSTIQNRQIVIRFLKQQSRPSIKSIIGKKKSLQKKKKDRQLIDQKKYQDDNNSSENKIKLIKNRVRLSSFDQKEFLALKRSLELSLQQKFNNGNNSNISQGQQTFNHID